MHCALIDVKTVMALQPTTQNCVGTSLETCNGERVKRPLAHSIRMENVTKKTKVTLPLLPSVPAFLHMSSPHTKTRKSSESVVT